MEAMMTSLAGLRLSDDDHSRSINSIPFRFFDLSRELRDTIYSYTMKDHYGDSLHYSKPRFELIAFPLLNVRLTCRQFCREYDEEVLSRAMLIINVAHDDTQLPFYVGANAKGRGHLLGKVRKVALRFEAQFFPHTSMGPAHYEDLQSINETFPVVSKVANSLATCMSPDSSLRVELILQPFDFDVLAKDRWDPARYLSMRLSTRTDVQLSAHLYLKHDLCAHLPAVHQEDTEDMLLFLDGAQENYVILAAEPSSHSDAWHGLKLTTHEAGKYDYDEALATARAKLGINAM